MNPVRECIDYVTRYLRELPELKDIKVGRITPSFVGALFGKLAEDLGVSLETVTSAASKHSPDVLRALGYLAIDKPVPMELLSKLRRGFGSTISRKTGVDTGGGTYESAIDIEAIPVIEKPKSNVPLDELPLYLRTLKARLREEFKPFKRIIDAIYDYADTEITKVFNTFEEIASKNFPVPEEKLKLLAQATAQAALSKGAKIERKAEELLKRFKNESVPKVIKEVLNDRVFELNRPFDEVVWFVKNIFHEHSDVKVSENVLDYAVRQYLVDAYKKTGLEVELPIEPDIIVKQLSDLYEKARARFSFLDEARKPNAQWAEEFLKKFPFLDVLQGGRISKNWKSINHWLVDAFRYIVKDYLAADSKHKVIVEIQKGLPDEKIATIEELLNRVDPAILEEYQIRQRSEEIGKISVINLEKLLPKSLVLRSLGLFPGELANNLYDKIIKSIYSIYEEKGLDALLSYVDMTRRYSTMAAYLLSHARGIVSEEKRAFSNVDRNLALGAMAEDLSTIISEELDARLKWLQQIDENASVSLSDLNLLELAPKVWRILAFVDNKDTEELGRLLAEKLNVKEFSGLRNLIVLSRDYYEEFANNYSRSMRGELEYYFYVSTPIMSVFMRELVEQYKVPGELENIYVKFLFDLASRGAFSGEKASDNFEKATTLFRQTYAWFRKIRGVSPEEDVEVAQWEEALKTIEATAFTDRDKDAVVDIISDTLTKEAVKELFPKKHLEYMRGLARVKEDDKNVLPWYTVDARKALSDIGMVAGKIYRALFNNWAREALQKLGGSPDGLTDAEVHVDLVERLRFAKNKPEVPEFIKKLRFEFDDTNSGTALRELQAILNKEEIVKLYSDITKQPEEAKRAVESLTDKIQQLMARIDDIDEANRLIKEANADTNIYEELSIKSVVERFKRSGYLNNVTKFYVWFKKQLDEAGEEFNIDASGPLSKIVASSVTDEFVSGLKRLEIVREEPSGFSPDDIVNMALMGAKTENPVPTIAKKYVEELGLKDVVDFEKLGAVGLRNLVGGKVKLLEVINDGFKELYNSKKRVELDVKFESLEDVINKVNKNNVYSLASILDSKLKIPLTADVEGVKKVLHVIGSTKMMDRLIKEVKENYSVLPNGADILAKIKFENLSPSKDDPSIYGINVQIGDNKTEFRPLIRADISVPPKEAYEILSATGELGHKGIAEFIRENWVRPGDKLAVRVLTNEERIAAANEISEKIRNAGIKFSASELFRAARENSEFLGLVLRYFRTYKLTDTEDVLFVSNVHGKNSVFVRTGKDSSILISEGNNVGYVLREILSLIPERAFRDEKLATEISNRSSSTQETDVIVHSSRATNC